MRNLSIVRAPGEDPAVARDVTIKLRVSQAEADAMKAAADKAGIGLSEWIRRQCLDIRTTIEVRAITETKRRRS